LTFDSSAWVSSNTVRQLRALNTTPPEDGTIFLLAGR